VALPTVPVVCNVIASTPETVTVAGNAPCQFVPVSTMLSVSLPAPPLMTSNAAIVFAALKASLPALPV